MDLFHILIFPVKILHASSLPLFVNSLCFEEILKCNCCLKATLSMACIWIALNQVFTEFILVLNLQREGPEVLFVSLLNSPVNRSHGLLKRDLHSNLHQIPFHSVCWIGLCLLSSKIVSSLVGILQCENFWWSNAKDSQINIFSAWRCCSISDSLADETNDNITETDFMYDKPNVTPFTILSYDFLTRPKTCSFTKKWTLSHEFFEDFNCSCRTPILKNNSF